MRTTARRLGLTLLWVIGLWPLLLLLLYSSGPLRAVQFEIAAENLVSQLLLAFCILGAILLLVYPPFPAGVRLLASRLMSRLRTDREPLLRAQSDLRNFESAARHLDAGRAALNTGSPEVALPHLVRSLELEPDQPAAMHKLGQALLELGKPAAAIGPLRRTVALAPEQGFGDALLQLGYAYMRSGDSQNAADVLTRYNNAHGGSRKSHAWLGTCLRLNQQPDAAREAFQIAAAAPADGQRLNAEESWYRATARVALWGKWGKEQQA